MQSERSLPIPYEDMLANLMTGHLYLKNMHYTISDPTPSRHPGTCTPAKMHTTNSYCIHVCSVQDRSQRKATLNAWCLCGFSLYETQSFEGNGCIHTDHHACESSARKRSCNRAHAMQVCPLELNALGHFERPRGSCKSYDKIESCSGSPHHRTLQLQSEAIGVHSTISDA